MPGDVIHRPEGDWRVLEVAPVSVPATESTEDWMVRRKAGGPQPVIEYTAVRVERA